MCGRAMFQYRGGGSRSATSETLSLSIVTTPFGASRSSVSQMIPPVPSGRASIALWTTSEPSAFEYSSVPVSRFLRRKRFGPLSSHTRWDPTWGKEAGPGATEDRKLGPRTAVPTTAAVAPPSIRHNPYVSNRTQSADGSQEQATGHRL